jgi:hypothetical protein
LEEELLSQVRNAALACGLQKGVKGLGLDPVLILLSYHLANFLLSE